MNTEARGSEHCPLHRNVQVLQHANVETFIVFRSTTPIFVALADAVFRPHAAIFPSFKTWMSLVRPGAQARRDSLELKAPRRLLQVPLQPELVPLKKTAEAVPPGLRTAQLLIMLGALGYVLVDSEISAGSYIWGAIYTVIICTEMARSLSPHTRSRRPPTGPSTRAAFACGPNPCASSRTARRPSVAFGALSVTVAGRKLHCVLWTSGVGEGHRVQDQALQLGARVLQ